MWAGLCAPIETGRLLLLLGPRVDLPSPAAWDEPGHSEGESLGMGVEKKLRRKVPPQNGDQWGSLTSKCVR